MKRLFLLIALTTLLFLVDVSTAQGNSLPDSAYISGLTGHAQGYRLSCESRSAVDLAGFWGLSIGETEFLQALPHSDNPEQGFVGNPNEAWGNLPPNGYGVHATPVADTLQSYGLDAIGLSNLSWDDLRAEISAGHPVIVWIIGAMWDGTPVHYHAEDGSTAVVATFEHTMILTGYNQNTVQVVDAYNGQYQTYPLSMFLRSWEVLGNMAVFASPQVTPQDEPEAGAHADSYVVQPGDYVIALAKRFGTSWIELAKLNSIGFPYVIQPGQVLQIPVHEEPAAEVVPSPGDVQLVEDGKAVIFLARLPLVQRNYSAETGQSMVSVPTTTGTAASGFNLGSYLEAHFGDNFNFDYQLLASLRDLLLPYLISTGELLKLK